MSLQFTIDTPQLPKRLVIIGAQGFIGTVMKRQADLIGVQTVPITRVDVDLESEFAADMLCEYFHEDDAVIVAAGAAPIKDALTLNRANVISEAVCKAVKQKPVQSVVNISSDSVFSELNDEIDESFLCSPSSIYGVSHLTRELMLSELPSSVSVTNIRPTLLFGLGNDKAGYGFDAFFRQASQGQDIRLFGEGNELRDYVWVEDMARLAMQCLMYRTRGTIIAASGQCYTFAEVASIVSEFFDVKVKHIENTSATRKYPEFRRFKNQLTFNCFPDFQYTPPINAFEKIMTSFQKVAI